MIATTKIPNGLCTVATIFAHITAKEAWPKAYKLNCQH